MSHGAPSGGYVFGNKNQWRRDTYGLYRSELERRSKRLADAKLFMMPGPTDAEIRHALRVGFSERHIHICDDNAARVAVHRKSFPALGGTYGVDVARAFDRLEPNTIHCASLDFTGCVADPVMDALTAVGRSHSLKAVSTVVVNVQRGREPAAWLRSMRECEGWHLTSGIRQRCREVAVRGYEISPMDAVRVAYIGNALCGDNGAVRIARVGSYRSNAVTMLWAGFVRYDLTLLSLAYRFQVEELADKTRHIAQGGGHRNITSRRRFKRELSEVVRTAAELLELEKTTHVASTPETWTALDGHLREIVATNTARVVAA